MYLVLVQFSAVCIEWQQPEQQHQHRITMITLNIYIQNTYRNAVKENRWQYENMKTETNISHWSC